MEVSAILSNGIAAMSETAGQVIIGHGPGGAPVYATPISPQQAQYQAQQIQYAAAGHIAPGYGVYAEQNPNYPIPKATDVMIYSGPPGTIASLGEITPGGYTVIYTPISQAPAAMKAAGMIMPPAVSQPPVTPSPAGTVPIRIGTVTQGGQAAPVVVNVPNAPEWSGRGFQPVLFKVSPAGEYSQVQYGFKEEYAEGTKYGIAPSKEAYSIMAGQQAAETSYQKADVIGKAKAIAGTLLGRYGPELEASQIVEGKSEYTGKPRLVLNLSESAAMPAITKQMALTAMRDIEIAKIPPGQYQVQAQVANIAQGAQEFFLYSTPGTIVTAWMLGGLFGGAETVARPVAGTALTKAATFGIGSYFLAATAIGAYETAASGILTPQQKIVALGTTGLQLYAGYKGYKSAYVEPQLEPVKFEAYPKNADYLVARYGALSERAAPWEFRAQAPESVGGGTFVLKPKSGAPRDWTYEAKIYSQTREGVEAGNVIYTISEGAQPVFGRPFKQITVKEDFMSRVTETAKEGTLTDIFYYDVAARTGETVTFGSGRATQSLIPPKPVRLTLWTGEEVGLYQPKIFELDVGLARQAAPGITYGGFPTKLYYVKAETGGEIIVNPVIAKGRIVIDMKTRTVPYTIDFWGVAPVVEGRELLLGSQPPQPLEFVKAIQPPKGGPIKIIPGGEVTAAETGLPAASAAKTGLTGTPAISSTPATTQVSAFAEGKLVYPPGMALAEWAVSRQVSAQASFTALASGTASLLSTNLKQDFTSAQILKTETKLGQVAQKVTQEQFKTTSFIQTTAQETAQRSEQKLQQEEIFKTAEKTQQVNVPPIVPPILPVVQLPPWFSAGRRKREEVRKFGFSVPAKAPTGKAGRIWVKRDPFTAMTEAFKTGKARLAPLSQSPAEQRRYAKAMFGPGGAAGRFGPRERKRRR